jgi:hypothetical protein
VLGTDFEVDGSMGDSVVAANKPLMRQQDLQASLALHQRLQT